MYTNCYKRSAGTANKHQEEYIGYRLPGLPTTMIVLSGIVVTPYRAYWHPEGPCYAPSGVRVQIGKVSDNGIFILRYETDEYPISAVMEPQECTWPRPFLLSTDMIIRVFFIGKPQIQTLQMDEMEDLYYTCIAHVAWTGLCCLEERATFSSPQIVITTTQHAEESSQLDHPHYGQAG